MEIKKTKTRARGGSSALIAQLKADLAKRTAELCDAQYLGDQLAEQVRASEKNCVRLGYKVGTLEADVTELKHSLDLAAGREEVIEGELDRACKRIAELEAQVAEANGTCSRGEHDFTKGQWCIRCGARDSATKALLRNYTETIGKAYED